MNCLFQFMAFLFYTKNPTQQGPTLKFLLILPIVFLFLNAAEDVVKHKNILFSQNASNACNVNFIDLLHEGLKFHPSIAMSKDILRGAEFGVDSAFWGYFPTPSVDVSAVDANKMQTVIRLDQPIWTGGKLDAAYHKAQAGKDEALHNYDEFQYTLINNFLSTLENYLQAQEKIEVLNDNKMQFNDLNGMLDRMITAGISSDADKKLLQSRLANIYSDLVVTKAKYKIAQMQFEILSSQKINCNVKFESDNIPVSGMNIEKLVDDILRFHPALKKIDAQIKAAISETESSKAKLWPSLILRGEHREGSLYAEIGSPVDNNLVYLTLQVSPGAGLSSLSNINAAQINISKIRYQKSAKEKELIDDLMNDYTNYVAAVSGLEEISTNIVTLRNVYESNKRLFLSEEKKWFDLVNALSELNKQKIDYSKLLTEKKVLEYKILLKTGKIDLTTGEIAHDI